MNVVHINEHLARKGGVETYLLSLLPLLQARGVASTVVYGAGDPGEYAPSIPVAGVGRASFGDQAATRREVHAALERTRPDVIHLHNVQNVGVLQACLSYGPTVLTAHDYRSVCPAFSFFYKRTQEVCGRTCGPGCFATTLTKHCLTPRPPYAAYFYYRSRWFLQHAEQFARVIAPSSGACDRLLQAGFPDERLVVLPYYCALEPLPEPRPLPERPTITFMGRIAPNKGHEYFVQALGLLPASVQGVMVGNFSGSSEQVVRGLARAHGCDERLTLRPWASPSEVVDVLDRTTVFVFPSLWPETLGIVGIEALARGVPVVASDLGGVREWLRDGENGWLVPPKAPERIRDAVLDLLASDDRLRAFGTCGIDTIHDRFQPGHHADRLVRLYSQATRQAVSSMT